MALNCSNHSQIAGTAKSAIVVTGAISPRQVMHLHRRLTAIHHALVILLPSAEPVTGSVSTNGPVRRWRIGAILKEMQQVATNS
jgi:hypothetical protein